MNANVVISLPSEQLQLLEEVKAIIETQVSLQMRDAYLTTEQAAERLKISVSTLNTWRDQGWLRYFAQGATVRYRTDYLDADFEKKTLVGSSVRPHFITQANKRRAS